MDSDSDDETKREAPAAPPGCDHDHSAEQRIYDLSPTENLACCALYKRQGNLYYREGQYSRAVDRYSRALVYYEYCFPSTENGLAALEKVRLTCLLNTAACDLKMSRWTDAVSHSSQALGIDRSNVKALYRRAVAQRHLGEFDAASADIGAAIALDPADLILAREQALLASRRRGYRSRAACVARRMARAITEGGFAAEVGAAPFDEGKDLIASTSTDAAAVSRDSESNRRPKVDELYDDAGNSDPDDDARSVATDASFQTDASALSATFSLDSEGSTVDVGAGMDGDLSTGARAERPWMVTSELLSL